MRKEERILNALTDVKEEYIEAVDLEEGGQGKSSRKGWKNSSKWIGLAASIAILVLVSTLIPEDLFFDKPKDKEQFVTETENSEQGQLDQNWVEGANGENLLVIHAAFDFGAMGSGQVNEDEIDTDSPWNASMKIETLPVYKNLAYFGPTGEPVYLEREQLLSMAEDVAEKIGAKIVTWEYHAVQDKPEQGSDVYQITATTELGEIQISGNGEVYITFSEGIELPKAYIISDEASVEKANETVVYLMKQFADLIQIENYIARTTVSYNLLGDRYMSYKATGYDSGINGILEYHFNKVYFYGDEEDKLFSLRYGDVRIAAEKLGDYPIITIEEAKQRLLDGKFVSILPESDVKGGAFSDENIKAVDLVYMTGSVCQYYQPYYCFYAELEEVEWGYAQFYVPALETKFLGDYEELNPLGN